MKKAQFLAPLIAVLIIACGTPSDQPSKEESLQKQNRMLVRSAIDKNKQIREYEDQLSSLEQRIKRIRERNIPLAIATGNEELPKNSFNSQLTMIENFLEQSRYDLALMKEDLLSKGRELKATDEQLQVVRNHLENQFARVDQLQDSLAQNEIILGIHEQLNQSLACEVEVKENELNKAWFAFGTFEELRQKEVAEKKGGILGIGSVKLLTAEFNKEYFTEVDITETSRIPIMSHKAEIITNHPRDSYEIVGSDQVEYIEIIDPQEFWKVSKYLAVIVK